MCHKAAYQILNFKEKERKEKKTPFFSWKPKLTKKDLFMYLFIYFKTILLKSGFFFTVATERSFLS